MASDQPRTRWSTRTNRSRTASGSSTRLTISPSCPPGRSPALRPVLPGDPGRSPSPPRVKAALWIAASCLGPPLAGALTRSIQVKPDSPRLSRRRRATAMTAPPLVTPTSGAGWPAAAGRSACWIEPEAGPSPRSTDSQGRGPGEGEGARRPGEGQQLVQRQQVRVERFGGARHLRRRTPARPAVRSRAASAWHAPRSRSKRFPAAWIPPGRRGLPGCRRRAFPSGCPWRGRLRARSCP